MQHRVLIVGAGATGSVLAAELVRRLRMPLFITIWDKAKGAGGRMSTSRGPTDAACRADIGAQYFSTKPNNKLCSRFYKELRARSLLRELELEQLKAIPGFRVADETSYFACTEGMSSIVKYFLNETHSNCNEDGSVSIFYSKRLKQLSVVDSKRSSLVWSVEADDGELSEFDSVIITVPVPQAVEIVQTVPQQVISNSDILSKLREVKYSSRYSVALFFRRDAPDAVRKFPLMKYYENDALIRYASLCNAMRGDTEAEIPAALVFQTTTSAGADAAQVDKVEAEKRIMEQLKAKVEPTLPYDYAENIKFHRWRYSQVTQAYADRPGYAVLCEKPLLICAGDGFTCSNFDGCIESAVKTADFFYSEQTKA